MTKLLLNEEIYCVLTFEWYRKPKDDCNHEWKQTRNEDEWGEWTCIKCNAMGRCDVWD